jgi:hypothetical protein
MHKKTTSEYICPLPDVLSKIVQQYRYDTGCIAIYDTFCRTLGPQFNVKKLKGLVVCDGDELLSEDIRLFRQMYGPIFSKNDKYAMFNNRNPYHRHRGTTLVLCQNENMQIFVYLKTGSMIYSLCTNTGVQKKIEQPFREIICHMILLPCPLVCRTLHGPHSRNCNDRKHAQNACVPADTDTINYPGDGLPV